MPADDSQNWVWKKCRVALICLFVLCMVSQIRFALILPFTIDTAWPGTLLLADLSAPGGHHHDSGGLKDHRRNNDRLDSSPRLRASPGVVLGVPPVLPRSKQLGQHQQQEQQQQQYRRRQSQVAGAEHPHKIPHRIIFTHRYDLLANRTPGRLYDNVQHTIRSYRDAWDDINAPVWFLNNDQCRETIQSVRPDLVPYFDNETEGAHKGDICRVAALYLTGGYYFDVDMKVVEPVRPPADVGFVSVRMPERNGFFQSFIATEPYSPILNKAFDTMIDYYNGDDMPPLMGTVTLLQAYDALSPEERGETLLLDEYGLEANASAYPHIPRQDGLGACNHVVHDADKSVVYFYSRIVGYGKNCMVHNSTEAIEFLKQQEKERKEVEERQRREQMEREEEERKAEKRRRKKARRRVLRRRKRSWTKLTSLVRRYSHTYERFLK